LPHCIFFLTWDSNRENRYYLADEKLSGQIFF
jgi:hypothetical protein